MEFLVEVDVFWHSVQKAIDWLAAMSSLDVKILSSDLLLSQLAQQALGVVYGLCWGSMAGANSNCVEFTPLLTSDWLTTPILDAGILLINRVARQNGVSSLALPLSRCRRDNNPPHESFVESDSRARMSYHNHPKSRLHSIT